MKPTTGLLLVFMVSAAVAGAGAATTVSATHHSAWGANIGWINARGDVDHGAVIGSLFCTGHLWSANCGWISLGKSPTNGWHYGNASPDDWGVNHDGAGALTGYAWGANIGWIRFEQEYGRPRIDLRTGIMSGSVWGANIGWISLSNAQAFVRSSLSPGPDTDNDGIPDAWEMSRAGDLMTLRRDHDADSDGASDEGEYGADTHPFEPERLVIISLERQSGSNVVSWACRPTRLYAVEATNALPGLPAAWSDVGGGLLGPSASSPARAGIPEAGATSRFYRIRAVVPLAE